MKRKSTILLAVALGVGACAGVGATKRDLRTAVDARQSSLDDCYAKALERDPAAAGTISVEVTVGEKSRAVETVEFSDPGFADSELQECLRATLVGVKVDAKPKANVRVEYQMEFEPS